MINYIQSREYTHGIPQALLHDSISFRFVLTYVRGILDLINTIRKTNIWVTKVAICDMDTKTQSAVFKAENCSRGRQKTRATHEDETRS